MIHFESRYLKAWCSAHVKYATIAGVLAWPEPTVVNAKKLELTPAPWVDPLLRGRFVDWRHQQPVRERAPPVRPKIDRNVLAVDALKAVDDAVRRKRGRGLTGVEQLEWCRRIDTELKRMGI